MAITCPNRSLRTWKDLVNIVGEEKSYILWNEYDGNVPESFYKNDISLAEDLSVNYQLKSVNILQSDKAKQVFNTLNKNKVTGDNFWNKVMKDLQIPKEQIDLMKESNSYNRDEILLDLASKYNYSVKVKTAETSHYYNIQDDEIEDMISPNSELGSRKENTSYYSNLTVPGGTKGTYVENDIQTPAISPSIQSHAQFAKKDKSIGWFRADDRQLYNMESIDYIMNELEKSKQLIIKCD